MLLSANEEENRNYFFIFFTISITVRLVSKMEEIEIRVDS